MEFSRTDPFEAKNRNGQAQDQGHNFASGPVKKAHRARTAHFLRNFRISEKKVLELETEVKVPFSSVTFLFDESKNSAVLGPRAGYFRGL